MKEVHCAYVLDDNGIVVVSYENPLNEIEKLDPSYFSNFFSAIQSLASSFGEGKEVGELELGNHKIVATKDSLTDYYFLITCDPDVKTKKIQPLLNRIKNAYINLFLGNFSVTGEERNEKISQFLKRLEEMFKDKDRVSNFLKGL